MLPHEIEQESFRIILSEIGPHHFTSDQLAVVVRMIHATGDFEFRDTTRFHPRAVASGTAALRRGCTVVTDVTMVEAGISSSQLERMGGHIVCDIGDPDVREQAQAQGLTRSTLAMRRNARNIQGGIVAIGNAPTALLEVIRLIREDGIEPALVIGLPVGFVNAAESKDELLTLDIPYITATGRKGGSPVAAAVVNALLKLAQNSG